MKSTLNPPLICAASLLFVAGCAATIGHVYLWETVVLLLALAGAGLGLVRVAQTLERVASPATVSTALLLPVVVAVVAWCHIEDLRASPLASHVAYGLVVLAAFYGAQRALEETREPTRRFLRAAGLWMASVRSWAAATLFACWRRKVSQ